MLPLPDVDESPSIAIVFEAPAPCPGRRAFVEDVEYRSERVRVAPHAADLPTYSVLVRAQEGAGFEGSLVSTDRKGAATEPHRVDGPSCEVVLQALSLTLALSIDPESRRGSSPALAAPTTVTGGQTVPTRPPRPADAGRGADDAASSKSAGDAAASTSWGPSLSLGAELRAMGQPPAAWWSLATAVRGRRHLPWVLVAPEFALGSSPRADFVGLQARAESCPIELGWSFLGVGPCMGVSAGFLRASGRGLDEAETISAGTLSFRPGARVGLGLGDVLLEAFGGVDVHAVRPRFIVQPGGSIEAETSPLGGGVGLSAGMRLR